MRLLVTGGQQRSALTMADRLNGDWYEYGRAVAAVIDTATSEVSVVAEVGPEDATPSFADQLTFKGASISDDELLICTMTDVRRFALHSLSAVGSPVTSTLMNDVHHAIRLKSGEILVANAGLDNCLIVDDAGWVIEAWNGLTGARDEQIRRDPTDYRLISTKPHECHPNQVFEYDGDSWMTRFHQRDAVTLDGSRRIAVGLERMHDGVVFKDDVIFTTVDGNLVFTSPTSARDHRRIDLTALDGREEHLGWLRGLATEGQDASRIWVGFSRIRPSKWRANLQFIKNGFAGSLPTRIALYDLKAGRLDRELDLETFGLDAVFSLLPLP